MHHTFNLAVSGVECDHERSLDDEPQSKLLRYVASDVSERNPVIDPYEGAFEASTQPLHSRGPECIVGIVENSEEIRVRGSSEPKPHYD
jgi:hypothetical protein